MSDQEPLRTFVFAESPQDSNDLISLLKSHEEFNPLIISHSLQEAEEILNKQEDHFQIAFVPYSGASDMTFAFLALARGTRRGQDCAYVLSFCEDDIDHALESSEVPQADACLFEPHSIATSADYRTLVQAVRAQREEEREAPVLEFLLHDALDHIDRLAAQKSQGQDRSHRLQYVDGIKTALETSNKDLHGLYFNLAVTKLTK